jgi:acyl-CoA thioesterase FadM
MVSLSQNAIFQVDQLGIKDIDAYGHVWYGNYIKFFTRSARAFLGGCTVRRVEHLKYKKSVPWGAAHSRIESYLVAREPATATVLQRWCVGDEEDNTYALCLLVVDLPPGSADALPVMAGAEKLARNGPMLKVAVKGMEMNGVKPNDNGAPVLGLMQVQRHVFADMVACDEGVNGGRLELADIMDLFEQSRTEFVGGQPGLKAFMDGGLALVVGQIDGLVISSEVRVSGGDTVCCEVTLLREKVGRKCFDFEQRLLRADSSEIARVYVLMCCVHHEKGELTRVPDENWNEWMARFADHQGAS